MPPKSISAPSLKKAKLGSQVADSLRRDILEGKLRAGDRLPREEELMTAFEVSRPTLREGLRLLESLQFIRIYRGKKGGAEVMLPTKAATVASAANYLQGQMATLEDLIKARMAIEPVLLLALKDEVGPTTIARLQEIIDAGENSDRDPKSITEMLSAFRRTLFGSLQNPVLNLIASLVIEMHEPIMLEIVIARNAAIDKFPEQSFRYLKRQLAFISRNDLSSASDVNLRYLQELLRMLNDLDVLKVRISAIGYAGMGQKQKARRPAGRQKSLKG